MPDWRTLNDAYGPATEVGPLLASVSPDMNSPIWESLWSRLCHQGSVYSASIVAVPELTRLAAERAPAERLAYLSLASAIVASADIHPPGLDRVPLLSVLPQLERLALEATAASGWSQTDFIYLLQAILAFRGDSPWGTELDRLVDGEFTGTCPNCGAELYLVIAATGCFAAAEDYVSAPDVPRSPLHPNTKLPRVGEWLQGQAHRAGHSSLAAIIPYLFGGGSCPECGEAFRLPDVFAV